MKPPVVVPPDKLPHPETMTPDAERQRLEGLFSDAVIARLVNASPWPTVNETGADAIRRIIVDTILAAPPAPGLREALTLLRDNAELRRAWETVNQLLVNERAEVQRLRGCLLKERREEETR